MEKIIEPIIEDIKPHTPAPEVEPQSSPDPIEYEPSEMKEPYIIELIDGLKFAKDQFEMPILLKEINDFVLTQSEDKKSYEEVINKYLKKLNLDRADIYTKIENLAELIRIDKKLIEAARAKEEFLKKPIEELTSRQLQERINAERN